MLSPYRVLDLTDEKGQLAGAMLADAGAEVILIEPPGGSAARTLGPWVEGKEGDPESSLRFWAYNRGKKGVVLDLDDEVDRAKFLELVRSADLVIESYQPGYMAEKGLSVEELHKQNPGLIVTSITAFGQSGPKSDWLATDLTIGAASLVTNLVGDNDRPPLRVPLDQSWMHASLDAAVGSLIALHERIRSGRGQHVDVSAQQAFTAATQSMSLCSLYNSPEVIRFSGGLSLGPFTVRLRSPASDGYVSATILFGEGIGPFTRRLFEWIFEEGMCDEEDVEIDWINFVDGVMTGQIGLGEYDRLQEVAAQFTATKTKEELLQASLDKRLLVVPITTVEDVVKSEQYADRQFWRDIEHQELGLVRYPGPFAKLSSTPLKVDTSPPRLGEHNAEVFAVERAVEEQISLNPTDGSDLPLSDVKILDLMWVMAGPAASRVLADWGANVIRVESANKVETARTIQPFLNEEGGADNSGLFQNMNAGKTGLTLDMSKAESREVILDLVKWADVVCESFSPKAMASWGLSYDDLREVNPSIIMTSSCLFGQTGPLSSLAGYGTMGASMSGFYDMTSWPDRDPAGVFAAYTDYVSPRFLATAILSALDHRRRTGEGQYIDLAQAEATVPLMAPAVLDYTVNGKLPEKLGNRHPAMSPHGVYPVAGEDQWIAIACENQEQWELLSEVLGRKDWTDLDQGERRELEQEIDDAIALWTSALSGSEAQELMQSAGIPAHRVQNSADLVEDPQLKHRRHFREVASATHGTVFVEGTRFQMSRSVDEITDSGPTYGQHTFEVLEGILGYDAEKIADLAVAGVLE